MSTTDNTIEEITNGNITGGEWIGTGIFDVLINAVNKNIEVQFNKGRITSTQYSDVYLGGLQAVLQQSIQFVLQADTSAAQTADIIASTAIKQREIAEKEATGIKQREVLQAQADDTIASTAIKQREIVEKEASGAKQREVLDAQKQLYTRQKDSFDDNKYQKILEAQLAYHQMTYADNPSPIIPDMILNNAVMDVFNKVMSNQPVSVYAE
jgi:hypothetical protein